MSVIDGYFPASNFLSIFGSFKILKTSLSTFVITVPFGSGSYFAS
jgi:hypothetical protein